MAGNVAGTGWHSAQASVTHTAHQGAWPAGRPGGTQAPAAPSHPGATQHGTTVRPQQHSTSPPPAHSTAPPSAPNSTAHHPHQPTAQHSAPTSLYISIMEHSSRYLPPTSAMRANRCCTGGWGAWRGGEGWADAGWVRSAPAAQPGTPEWRRPARTSNTRWMRPRLSSRAPPSASSPPSIVKVLPAAGRACAVHSSSAQRPSACGTRKQACSVPAACPCTHPSRSGHTQRCSRCTPPGSCPQSACPPLQQRRRAECGAARVPPPVPWRVHACMAPSPPPHPTHPPPTLEDGLLRGTVPRHVVKRKLVGLRVAGQPHRAAVHRLHARAAAQAALPLVARPHAQHDTDVVAAHAGGRRAVGGVSLRLRRGLAEARGLTRRVRRRGPQARRRLGSRWRRPQAGLALQPAARRRGLGVVDGAGLQGGEGVEVGRGRGRRREGEEHGPCQGPAPARNVAQLPPPALTVPVPVRSTRPSRAPRCELPGASPGVSSLRGTRGLTPAFSEASGRRCGRSALSFLPLPLNAATRRSRNFMLLGGGWRQGRTAVKPRALAGGSCRSGGGAGRDRCPRSATRTPAPLLELPGALGAPAAPLGGAAAWREWLNAHRRSSCLGVRTRQGVFEGRQGTLRGS